MHHSTFVWIAASVVGVLSVARTARFLVWDEFPLWLPIKTRLMAVLGDAWGGVFGCQYCIAPYLAAGMGVWVWLSDLNAWWWIINGWWAASYLAAIVVSYDESG